MIERFIVPWVTPHMCLTPLQELLMAGEVIAVFLFACAVVLLVILLFGK